MPVPNIAPTSPTVDEAMTKMLRLLKRYRRARARWTPKRLELDAIPV